VKEGQIEKAIGAYEEVVSSGDADPYDFVYAGDLYLKVELRDEAISRFGRGVSAYGRLGFNRNAIALCRRILKLDSEQVEIHRELGDLYASEELVDDALEAYLTYLEGVAPEERDGDMFRETLAHAEELAPQRPKHASRLSDFLLAIGHSEASADLLARSAEHARSSGTEEASGGFLEQAAGMNPALQSAVGDVGGVVERLQERVRAREAEAGSSAEQEAGSIRQVAAQVDAGAAGQDPGGEQVAESGSAGRAHVAGFQEIDLSGAESEHATDSQQVKEMSPQSAADEHGATAQSAEEPSGAGSRTKRDVSIDEGEDPAASTRDAIDASEWELARRWLDAWLLDDPTSTEAAEALIRISEELGDTPGIIEGLTLKGDLLIQEQDLAGAVPPFWRILELDPGNETASRRMARFRELGLVAADAQPREEDGGAVSESDPGSVGEEMPLQGAAEELPCAAEELPSGEVSAAVDAGASAEMQGQGEPVRVREPARQTEVMEPQKAMDILRELREGSKVQVDPGDSRTHYEEGVAHLEGGRFEEALVEFEAPQEKRDLTPAQSAQLRELRGKCLAGLARHREAIAEFEPALEMLGADGEDVATLKYLLALEYEALGELDAARERLREVLQACPDFEEAARRLSQLEDQAA
jgi:tetratricopeptide (TPR) repeat protein